MKMKTLKLNSALGALLAGAFLLSPLAKADDKADAYKYGKEGIEAAKNKEWDKAIDLFQKAVKADPKEANNYNNLGLAYKGANKPDEAIKASRTNARNMLRSLAIREPLQARMLAVAELPWHIEPEDKKDIAQLAVAKEIGSSEFSQEKPGKSRRIIPMSPDLRPVPLTQAGWALRASAHRRISS